VSVYPMSGAGISIRVDFHVKFVIHPFGP
jgi:hypothetical protein